MVLQNEAKALGVNLPIMPMGCNFGDINNDVVGLFPGNQLSVFNTSLPT